MAVDVPGPFATKDELDAALGIFEATAEAHPTDAEAHLNIGLLAKRRSKLAVAAEALRRVVELRPSDDDAKRNLAGVLVDMGYVDDAEVWLRDLISREPPVQPNTRPTRTEAQLANLLLDGRGERSAALRVFERACRCGPTPLAFLAGVVADSLGDHSAAMAFYQQSWHARAQSSEVGPSVLNPGNLSAPLTAARHAHRMAVRAPHAPQDMRPHCDGHDRGVAHLQGPGYAGMCACPDVAAPCDCARARVGGLCLLAQALRPR